MDILWHLVISIHVIQYSKWLLGENFQNIVPIIRKKVLFGRREQRSIRLAERCNCKWVQKSFMKVGKTICWPIKVSFICLILDFDPFIPLIFSIFSVYSIPIVSPFFFFFSWLTLKLIYLREETISSFSVKECYWKNTVEY